MLSRPLAECSYRCTRCVYSSYIVYCIVSVKSERINIVPLRFLSTFFYIRNFSRINLHIKTLFKFTIVPSFNSPILSSLFIVFVFTFFFSFFFFPLMQQSCLLLLVEVLVVMVVFLVDARVHVFMRRPWEKKLHFHKQLTLYTHTHTHTHIVNMRRQRATKHLICS